MDNREYRDISPEMTIGDLMQCGAYGAFAKYIFTYMTPDHFYAPLSNYGFETVGFEEGLHRMEELAASDGQMGASYVHHVYPLEERLAQWDKEYARYLYFPAKKNGEEDAARPYVIVIPGGGFNRQWGFIEGEAIAARLNQMGYPAFVLYYRTKVEACLPAAIADMHAAIRDIEAHAAEYHIQPGNYMIGGFSAGATLSALIGTDNFGWKQAGVPEPGLIFLGYPAVKLGETYQAYAALPDGSPEKEGAAVVLRRMVGPNIKEEAVAPYVMTDHIGRDYPKTYIIANEDDGTVSVSNSYAMDKLLTDLEVPHQTRIGKTGGHSFGLGNGLEVDGWLAEAVKYWGE